MEVVLKKDFPALGYVGDHVTVKAGYARNYLIPRGIAVEGSSKNARELEHRLAGIRAHKAKLKKLAEERKSALEGLKLEFTLKIGQGGKSFGSISAKDVYEAFVGKGQELDRKQIRLPESIKSGGSFVVEVRLHSEVEALVPIEVTTEVVKADEKKSAKKSRKDAALEAEAAATDGFDIDAIEDLAEVDEASSEEEEQREEAAE